MKYYQIGTTEDNGVVGSRAAKARTRRAAKTEAREYSKAYYVQEAWLREMKDGELGEVIVMYRNGKEV